MRHQTIRNLAGAGSGVRVAYGVVTTAPADDYDGVGVAFADRPDYEVAVTDDWNRGPGLPEVGCRCVLLTSPDVDPVILTWSPNA